MKNIRLPGTDFPVSEICLGCAYMGSRDSEELSYSLLDLYYEHGGRFLNTSTAYGHGLSEKCVGKWVRERGVRSQMIITSKCGEDFEKPSGRAMHYDDLLEDLDESLERTGFEYLDFYLLHVDDLTVPVSEIMDAMREMQRSGKIRHYGCSNWSVERQREAAAYADAHKIQRFVMDEIEMSVGHLNYKNSDMPIKWMDDEFINYHRECQTAAGAYSSTTGGALVKYLRDGDTRNWKDYQIANYKNSYNLEEARRLGVLSQKTGYTPAQLQLAWIIAQPYGFACFPIIGARTAEQLTDSLGAEDCSLTPEMIGYLEQKEDKI